METQRRYPARGRGAYTAQPAACVAIGRHPRASASRPPATTPGQSAPSLRTRLRRPVCSREQNRGAIFAKNKKRAHGGRGNLGRMPQHISKLLVANRGEIALRVVRTAREMGIPTVVVYAEQDRHCQYVQMADEAYLLSGDTYADTYLNEDLLISILERSGADAVHPGYGFLSEVASFATRVMDAGAVWVGPSPRALKALGDKISARNVATKAKVPPVPGISHAVSDMRVLLDFAHTHGYPLMMKRTDGGGGRGITLVRNDDELRGFYLNHNAVQGGDLAEYFVERFIDHGRHVETQCGRDAHGEFTVLLHTRLLRAAAQPEAHRRGARPVPGPGGRRAAARLLVPSVRGGAVRGARHVRVHGDRHGQGVFP